MVRKSAGQRPWLPGSVQADGWDALIQSGIRIRPPSLAALGPALANKGFFIFSH